MPFLPQPERSLRDAILVAALLLRREMLAAGQNHVIAEDVNRHINAEQQQQ
jgi:hypothetical protein